MSSIIAGIIISLAATIGYFSYVFYGADNEVEEHCETVIEMVTGVDLDLSPSTPECKKEVSVEEGPTASDLADIESVNANIKNYPFTTTGTSNS